MQILAPIDKYSVRIFLHAVFENVEIEIKYEGYIQTPKGRHR